MRRAFSLLELLVVITILCLLMAVLFPVLVSAKGRAQRTACMAELRQMGHALEMYRADDDGMLPETLGQTVVSKGYSGPLLPYVGKSGVQCPMSHDDYMSRLGFVHVSSFFTGWWQDHGIHVLHPGEYWEPHPSFVIAMCPEHLLSGFADGKYQMWPASGPQGRRGRHVVLRIDGSAGETDAQAVRQYAPAIENGKPVWEEILVNNLPPSGRPIVDRFPGEPLAFDIPEGQNPAPGQ